MLCMGSSTETFAFQVYEILRINHEFLRFFSTAVCTNFGLPLSLLHPTKIVALPATDDGLQTDCNQRVKDRINVPSARTHPKGNH